VATWLAALVGSRSAVLVGSRSAIATIAPIEASATLNRTTRPTGIRYARMGGSNGTDPTARGRILRAATREYAARGRAATLDEIAAAAGVSRAEVDRHYAGEAELREAINEHLMNVALGIFGDAATSDDDDFDELGRRITALVRDHPDEMRFVARATIDGEPDGLGMFDAFMAIAIEAFRGLDEEGVLTPDLDVEWAALHVVVFNLAVVLFRDAIANHLPDPLGVGEGLERWHAADTALFRRGYLRPDQPEPRVTRTGG
jgi:AcrR family transcriptional regulator